MKHILLLIPFITFGQKIPDDVKHFYAGAGITFVSASIINHYTDKPTVSVCSGVAIGILSGLAKEFIYDKAMNRGVFSKDDYRMTGWGSLCGGIVIRCVIDYRSNGLKPRRNKNKYKID
jgi:hypothetical protein